MPVSCNVRASAIKWQDVFFAIWRKKAAFEKAADFLI